MTTHRQHRLQRAYQRLRIGFSCFCVLLIGGYITALVLLPGNALWFTVALLLCYYAGYYAYHRLAFAVINRIAAANDDDTPAPTGTPAA